METIKVIDLLNKIANGEELPKKIKWDDMIFTLGIIREVPTLKTANNIDIIEFIRARYLNDEAEIIEDAEEDKEIEKLDVALLGQCDNWLEKRDVNIKSDFELNPYIIENIRENTLYFQRKINEVIDVVNKLNKK